MKNKVKKVIAVIVVIIMLMAILSEAIFVNAAASDITAAAVLTEEDFDYEDNARESIDGHIYGYDEAVGYECGILEIPKIKMRQPVYTGTQEEIDTDLDRWFTTLANPEMVPEETGLTVYGHNSPTQELTFNHVKEVAAGDYVVFRTENATSLYIVSEFTAEWREQATAKYVNTVPDRETLIILTCGRDEYRYKDIVLTCKRIRDFSASEWDEYLKGEETVRKAVINEAEAIIETIPSVPDVPETSIRVSLSHNIVSGYVECNGEKVPDCVLMIYDSDGISYMPLYDGDEVELPSGEYVVGIWGDMPDGYGVPDDVELRVIEDVIISEEVGETSIEENYLTWIAIGLSFACLGVTFGVIWILLRRKRESVPNA